MFHLNKIRNKQLVTISEKVKHLLLICGINYKILIKTKIIKVETEKMEILATSCEIEI